jgi:6,7-dimethyl-8-ribityllumazine synthase
MNQFAAYSSQRIAFVQSSWHKEVVDRGRESFLHHAEQLGIAPHTVDVFTVPGAFEIPLHVRLLARSRQYRAVVACGFVVDGGIYRHEFVAQSVIAGLMQVQLEAEVPVFSIVLTPQQFHEHETHKQFFLEHMTAKGAEAADACVRTIESLGRLRDSIEERRRQPC